jgi:hypothetical protein
LIANVFWGRGLGLRLAAAAASVLASRLSRLLLLVVAAAVVFFTALGRAATPLHLRLRLLPTAT